MSLPHEAGLSNNQNAVTTVVWERVKYRARIRRDGLKSRPAGAAAAARA
jgi:hypothetical protein